MKINQFWSWEDPPYSKIGVVIDSYAATSNVNIMLQKKPKKLLVINEKNLRKAVNKYPDGLLIGESDKFAFEFLSSNHPSDIIKLNLNNKIVLYMSINGTKVFEKFISKYKRIITCAFVNLRPVSRWLIEQKISEVSLIMSGDISESRREKVEEDKICADILKYELDKQSYNWSIYKEKITDFINSYYGNPQKRYLSLPLVLDLNRYNVVPLVFRNKAGFLEVKKITS